MRRSIVFLLFVSLILLSACGSKLNSKQSSLTGRKESIVSVNSGTIIIKKNKIQLSVYDKAIIKMAVDKGVSMCLSLHSNNKITYCKNIVRNEKINFDKGNCKNLVYLKQQCLDNLNYKKRNCEKITDEFKRRNCDLQRNFDKVIKNGDISKCNQFPYPENQKCQKILTK